MDHRRGLSPTARRSTTFALSKILLVAIAQLPFGLGAPTPRKISVRHEGKSADDPELWINLAIAAALVLLGGAFAGLTIALMGQDEIYLQVIKTSGEGSERKNAAKVLKLLNKGKHWVLVTLLLSNVITNETLPIVLDHSLGGGWPAVLGSTVLIVIFGEIAPQSVCVRYGLPIGAWMAPFVLVLMYIMAPVAWPTAKLLDYLLGEEHGTIYKRAGLKTLVSLHRTMGEDGQQLNADEVTIISAVLDLKDKTVGAVMTEMDDVFTLSVDDVLNVETMNMILSAGYSRIPIHAADNDQDFVGMLLVKMLITYDPEDNLPVSHFALATLPETRPDTSCLDILNYFQEGKSHMVLVSENPGGDSGALGVVTLEDVIEELIGEEIIDESDVFIDVHKAIRRLAPAPWARIPSFSVPRGRVVEPSDSEAQGNENTLININEETTDGSRSQTPDVVQTKTRNSMTEFGSPRAATFMLRRRSDTAQSDKAPSQLRLKATDPQTKEHLSHLGPSNLASRPRATRYQKVKIKPPGYRLTRANTGPHIRRTESSSIYQSVSGEGVVTSAGKDASDGVQALKTGGYGTLSSSLPSSSRADHEADKGVQTNGLQTDGEETITIKEPKSTQDEESVRPGSSDRKSERSTSAIGSATGSLSGKMGIDRSPSYTSKGPARSGSILENVIDVNGVRKIVLQMTSSGSSNDSDDETRKHSTTQPENVGNHQEQHNGGGEDDTQDPPKNKSTKKKRRRKRKNGTAIAEEQPLLGS